MISATEEQEDVETEYFDYDQPGNEQTGNQRDNNGEETKTLTLRGLLEALANDRACIQAVLTIDPAECTFTFDPEGALLQISPIDGAAQRYISRTL